MQPHGIGRIARFPTLRAKLQRASLLYRDTFCSGFQMSFRNIEGIGQPTLSLLLEYRCVAAFDFADALGMDAGLLTDGLLTHTES